MPTRLSLFGRVFAPTWPMTLLTIVLLALFVSLGRWQWHRGEGKQAVWAEYLRESRPQPMGARGLADAQRFSRVQIAGTFDPAHQFLLDNRSHAGQPGYEVLTPFLSGERWLLVNRGWVRFTGYRDRLPDVSLPSQETVSIIGRVDDLPASGLASGRAAPTPGSAWPKLTSFPTRAELEAAFGKKLEPGMVLLDPKEPQGLLREWTPPGLDPARHFSYAIQWWGFALVLLVLYFGLNFRKVS